MQNSDYQLQGVITLPSLFTHMNKLQTCAKMKLCHSLLQGGLKLVVTLYQQGWITSHTKSKVQGREKADWKLYLDTVHRKVLFSLTARKNNWRFN